MLFAGMSWILVAYDLDRSLEQQFWSAQNGWHWGDNTWIQFLYRYGTWPALLAAGLGLIIWIRSYFGVRWKPFRQLGRFLVMAMLLGPGLLINGTFKELYGRPRPRQVMEFGGTERFRQIGEPTFDGNGKSFPSGHASMGFFWFAPCIYFWQRHRRLALVFAALALVHGGLMSFGRMAQGAHWPSDNLWAGAIVYLCSWAIYRGLRIPDSRTSSASPIPSIPSAREYGGAPIDILNHRPTPVEMTKEAEHVGSGLD